MDSTPRHLPAWTVVVVAALAALAVWVLAVPVLGVDLVAGTPPATIGGAQVVVVAAVVALGAWAVRTALARAKRLVRRSRAWWLTCGAVLLVSLGGPLGATTAGAVATLLALHLVVGAVVAVGLDPRRVQHHPSRVEAVR